MEKCENDNKKEDRSNGIASRAAALRCFFKQQGISTSLSVPIRIAPAWGRMLRFGNTAKFKIDEFLQVFIDLFICKKFDSLDEGQSLGFSAPRYQKFIIRYCNDANAIFTSISMLIKYSLDRWTRFCFLFQATRHPFSITNVGIK